MNINFLFFLVTISYFSLYKISLVNCCNSSASLMKQFKGSNHPNVDYITWRFILGVGFKNMFLGTLQTITRHLVEEKEKLNPSKNELGNNYIKYSLNISCWNCFNVWDVFFLKKVKL